jgi:hypothetical membrane protein
VGVRAANRRRVAATVVLACVGAFWGWTLVAAALNPGYSHGRDYVSTLASRGATHGWLGVLAIVAAACAMFPAAMLVRPLSRVAALAIGISGGAFLVVAVTRLECANGAARCGLGGRISISGASEVTHWTATTIGTVLLIAGIALAGLGFLRTERTVSGVASLTAAALTAGTFLAMGGSSPGDVQRLGIAVATGWLAAVAVATLVGRESTPSPSSG